MVTLSRGKPRLLVGAHLPSHHRFPESEGVLGGQWISQSRNPSLTQADLAHLQGWNPHSPSGRATFVWGMAKSYFPLIWLVYMFSPPLVLLPGGCSESLPPSLIPLFLSPPPSSSFLSSSRQPSRSFSKEQDWRPDESQGLESHTCHLAALWPRAIHVISLSLNFPIC